MQRRDWLGWTEESHFRWRGGAFPLQRYRLRLTSPALPSCSRSTLLTAYGKQAQDHQVAEFAFSIATIHRPLSGPHRAMDQD